MFASLLAAAALALAPPAPRFQVLGHAAAAGGYAGDVWGHAGFAYLSSHRGASACPAQGVRVFDVREPRRPRKVATFADGASEPELARSWTEKTIVRDVATPSFGGTLAVTSVQACRIGDGFQGFALYDVTNPSRPARLALVPLSPRGSHEIWLAAARGRAYVYTAIPYSEQLARRAGFRIYDVSDPRRPREVGDWSAVEALRVDPFRGRGREGRVNRPFVHSVITNAAATRAYLAYWDLGTVILDVSDPAKPRYLGRTQFTAGEDGNTHSGWLGRGERLLLETHETDGGTPTLFDVSRPASPRRLSAFRLPRSVLAAGHRRTARYTRAYGIDLSDSVHDPKAVGTRAFFSWYTQGVVAADIASPRRPRFLARFQPPATRDPYGLLCPRRACTAVWGVYPQGGVVLASDMLSGLWVLRLR